MSLSVVNNLYNQLADLRKSGKIIHVAIGTREIFGHQSELEISSEDVANYKKIFIHDPNIEDNNMRLIHSLKCLTTKRKL